MLGTGVDDDGRGVGAGSVGRGDGLKEADGAKLGRGVGAYDGKIVGAGDIVGAGVVPGRVGMGVGFAVLGRVGTGTVGLGSGL